MKVLVTGAAGFIGSVVCKKLVCRGDVVVGLDSVNDYYDKKLKHDRLGLLGVTLQEQELGSSIQSIIHSNFRFAYMNLGDSSSLTSLFQIEHFDAVVHLAAQAGVRYSLENPQAYVDSNISGFLNILEACRRFPVKHLVFASSSSVYGQNAKVPFSVDDSVDSPVSFYAVTKRTNELMAQTYSQLFGIPSTGLRFFTVYGPYGRPDMAPILFAKSILAGRPIEVFNHGNMKRDFTFIDDIVEGTIRVLDRPPESVPAYNLFNIGKGEPVDLMRFIQLLESALGKKANIELKGMQLGDVPATWADTKALEEWTRFKPVTSLEEGITQFAKWYLSQEETLRA